MASSHSRYPPKTRSIFPLNKTSESKPTVSKITLTTIIITESPFAKINKMFTLYTFHILLSTVLDMTIFNTRFCVANTPRALLAQVTFCKIVYMFLLYILNITLPLFGYENEKNFRNFEKPFKIKWVDGE